MSDPVVKKKKKLDAHSSASVDRASAPSTEVERWLKDCPALPPARFDFSKPLRAVRGAKR